MPLVTSKEMFEKAYNGGYAIGAFNVNNMEIIQGITEAAAELKAPLILQVSKGARAYANRTYLKKLVEAAVIETGLPIVLHLDHGDSFELCKSCVDFAEEFCIILSYADCIFFFRKRFVKNLKTVISGNKSLSRLAVNDNAVNLALCKSENSVCTLVKAFYR